MNTARYVVALLIIVALPPAVGYWFLIHPFIGFWRRLGRAPTFTIVFALMVLSGYGIVQMSDTILAIDFGMNYFLWPLVLVSYGASIRIEIACRKHLKFNTLVGAPELARDGRGGKLLSEGIYGRVRHPRYVAVMLGITAFALFANYLAPYILLPLSAVGLYIVTVLEERELRTRFGDEYVRYSERVPRFFPKIG